MNCDDDARSLDEIRADADATTRLPRTGRYLCLGTVEPDWVGLALRLESAGCSEPHFRWTSTTIEALGVLREESFDCLLIAGRSPLNDRIGGVDPLSFLRGLRGAGGEDPVVLITRGLSDGEWAALSELDCEILCTECGWTSAALVPMIERAIERRKLTLEHRRFTLADRRRLLRERDEADQLLRQQRQILSDLQSLAGSVDRKTSSTSSAGALAARGIGTSGVSATKSSVLPPEVDHEYQELLRTYVMMGSGNLGSEIARIADHIVASGLNPREALELHLERVENLVRGLGSRSTRHILARADLMALELMMHIAECERRGRELAEQPLVRRVNGNVGIDLTDLGR